MWKKTSFTFLLALIVGFVIGLFVIAWWLFPVPLEKAPINDLRTDLKIDYIRLVAASYASHGDVNTAIERLNLLSDPTEVLELALANSTAEEKNQILQLQGHLPPVVEANTLQDATESAMIISPALNHYVGYGFLAACILILGFVRVKTQTRQGRSPFRYLWSSSDIRKRMATVILLVVIYRFTTNIPLTGINHEAAQQAMNMTSEVHGGIGGFILSMDILSGGTISTFSVVSVGIYGYVLAQILVNLIFPIIPALQRRLVEDRREGEKLMKRWTIWSSLLLSIPLSWMLINLYSGKFAVCMGQLANPPDIQFGASNLLGTITIMLEIIAGAKFAEWLTDRVSDSFRGMGPAIIIAAGIMLGVMRTFDQLLTKQRPQEIVIFELLVIVLILLSIYIIQGRRNVPIMYPHQSQIFYARTRGKVARMPQPFLPLMVGMAGVIPILAIQGLLTLPVFVTVPLLCTDNVKWQAFAANTRSFFDASNPTYWLIFAILLVPFAFFYNEVSLSRQDYGRNLRHSGAQIPGVHSGSATDRYLQQIMRTITLPYSILLVTVAVLPYLTIQAFHLDLSPLLGVSIFILVGTIRDGYLNLEAELKLMGYQEKI